jgi:hypothetical protein
MSHTTSSPTMQVVSSLTNLRMALWSVNAVLA